jgi:nucleotide-binding universal stress UspA family protein
MYKHILVPLENSKYDAVILEHIRPLACCFDSKLTLVHVADGWGARYYDKLKLRESDEMKEDRAYLAQVADLLRGEGYNVETVLALGEPADEILRLIDETGCDLVAMTTHGHRFLSDFIYGTTVHKVRHLARVPILLLRAPG